MSEEDNLKMSTIQERLQLKRVPLDTWNVREQLCLASAVVRSGDQNWMSVSRALKTVGEPNRPPDWYSQKSCAAQYGALLEHVETPKRKKRSSEGAVETPQESILKRLTQERIVEIQKNVAEMNQQYEQIKNEINEVRNPATSDDRLRELWAGIEAVKRAREREIARRAAWLKEREERRARAERTWRPPATQTQVPGTDCVPASPAAPASPLLTSLLKSSPVVTTPQHISHPANVVETVSPSAGAPTLSMLLEKSGSGGSSPHESKYAAIEHIKSQLVQIEQQLKASTSTPSPVSLPPVPAVDIDDIEIKAEDVYAFRDIDIHIPPVATMHKGNARVIEKPTFKKEESDIVTPIDTEGEQIEERVKEEHTEPRTDEILSTDIRRTTDEVQDKVQASIPEAKEPTPEVEVKVSFPEVKFPTPEIKVIHSEDHKIKEEIKEPEVPPPEPEKEREEIKQEEAQTTFVEETIQPVVTAESNAEQMETPVETQMVMAPDPETIPLPPDPSPVVMEEKVTEPPPSEPEAQPKQEEPTETGQEEPKEEHERTLTDERKSEEKTLEDIKREEDAEDSIPLKEMMKEEAPPEVQEAEVKEERPPEPEDTHTETDDDTPMELSREEEKDGKKKRDYSRKKKSDSRTCSGSESAAEASAPESPSAGAGDADRQHRLWKRSVLLVYSRLCAHKYASLFLRPITDEEAPGYSLVVKRPMDLTTIKKHIEAGVIRTTAEFQRDVLLMLSNALMYNSSEHSVYRMAKDMHEEAQCQLGMLLAAQAHAGLAGECAPARRKRRRHDSPPHHHHHHQHHHLHKRVAH